MPPRGPAHPAHPYGVLAAGALPRQRAEGAAARRDLRPGLGLRLRSRFQLARRLRGLPATQARERRRVARDPHGSRRRVRHEGAVSFRLRVSLLAAAAVAVAAIGAAVAMYFLVQNQLIDQVDRTLAEAAITTNRGPRQGERGFPFGGRSDVVSGRQDIFGQLVDTNGNVLRADFGQAVTALVAPEVREVAAGQRKEFFATAESPEARLRIFVKPFTPGVALELARSLDDIDGALAQTRVTLAEFAFAAGPPGGRRGAPVGRGGPAPAARASPTAAGATRARALSPRGPPRRLGRGPRPR